MIGTAGGLARDVRSASFAAASALLALGAHVAGGGCPPGVAGTAVAVSVSAVAARAVGRRPRGTAGNLAVLAAVQVLLHESLAVTRPDAMAATHATGAPPMAAHFGHLVPGGWMLLSHALALVLTAVLLARGERLVEALGRALAGVPRLLAVLGCPLLPPRLPAGRPPAARRPTVVRCSVRACTPVVRRGPPAPAC